MMGQINYSGTTQEQRDAIYVVNMLNKLRAKCSNVSLSWGEDNNCWECECISSGRRFVSASESMVNAVDKVMDKMAGL